MTLELMGGGNPLRGLLPCINRLLKNKATLLLMWGHPLGCRFGQGPIQHISLHAQKAPRAALGSLMSEFLCRKSYVGSLMEHCRLVTTVTLTITD